MIFNKLRTLSRSNFIYILVVYSSVSPPLLHLTAPLLLAYFCRKYRFLGNNSAFSRLLHCIKLPI